MDPRLRFSNHTIAGDVRLVVKCDPIRARNFTVYLDLNFRILISYEEVIPTQIVGEVSFQWTVSMVSNAEANSFSVKLSINFFNLANSARNLRFKPKKAFDSCVKGFGSRVRIRQTIAPENVSYALIAERNPTGTVDGKYIHNLMKVRFTRIEDGHIFSLVAQNRLIQARRCRDAASRVREYSRSIALVNRRNVAVT